MDSGSSELNTQSSGGVTNEHYDADSLFCSGYFDLQFGCYSTDSVATAVQFISVTLSLLGPSAACRSKYTYAAFKPNSTGWVSGYNASPCNAPNIHRPIPWLWSANYSPNRWTGVWRWWTSSSALSGEPFSTKTESGMGNYEVFSIILTKILQLQFIIGMPTQLLQLRPQQQTV